MSETFFEKWRGRFRGAWHILAGRAYAAYYENYVPPIDDPEFRQQMIASFEASNIFTRNAKDDVR